MMKRRQLLLLTLLALLGCGEQPEIVPFAGKVLYNGEPLEFGAVMFQPVGGGQPSSAQIQSDGTFEMYTRGVGEGAAVGVNRVRVTCFPAQKQKTGGGGNQELALGRSLIPTKYNSFGSSGISVEVKPSDNEPCVIELDDR